MKRSKLLVLVSLATIVATVLAGCGATPTPTPLPTATKPPATATPVPAAPTATKPPAPTATTAAAAGGTLIGGFDVGPGGHRESRPYDQTAGNTWLMKIWSPLLSFNADISGLEPQLALKWSSNPDATKWTFNLRPNVKWHDGNPFTANDVKFTFELALNPNFGWRNMPGAFNQTMIGAQEYISGTAKEISGIKVVDPLTIEFSFKVADPKFPYKLTAAYILPKHILEKEDPAKLAKSDWFLASPVGTGPWKVVKYVKDQYQDTVPNEYYWNGKPKLAHLINRYFADETAASIAYEKGEIQFTYIAGDVAARLKANPANKIYEGPSFVTNYIIFNLRDKRLQDVRVRQAFWYAIDRKAIIKEVFKDAATILNCTLPEKTFWPKDLNPYDYNPDKAKQLLKEANWNSNDNLEMWTYYGTQQQKDALQAMQQYLAQVGIKITPKIMETPAYNAQFYTGEGWPLSYRGIGFVYGQVPRSFLLPSVQTNDKKSWAGNDDPKLIKMVEAAETATVEADYIKNLQDVCKYLNDSAIEASMWVGIRYGVASSKIKDFYWFPGPGGGPYEDHSEKWDIAP